jgi:hypothetical protein
MPGAAHPTPAQQRIIDIAAQLGALGIESNSVTLPSWCGAHPRSKGLLNDLGAMRSRELATKGWPVKPGAVLFMEGL